MIYQTNELTFNLPDGLLDRTVNIFALSDDGPGEFGLVVSRVPLKGGQTLRSYAVTQVAEMRNRMPAFVLIHELEGTVRGQPAMSLEFTWKSEAVTLHQRQVSFVVAATGGPVVMMITGTCRDRFSPKWTQAFEAAIESVQFGAG